MSANRLRVLSPHSLSLGVSANHLSLLWGLCPLTAPLCHCALGFESADRPTLLAGYVCPLTTQVSDRVSCFHPLLLLSQGAPSVHSPIYCQICLVFILTILLESELLLTKECGSKTKDRFLNFNVIYRQKVSVLNSLQTLTFH